MQRMPWLLGCAGLAVTLGTVSCTTLGTHVKGGFACNAPVGTCAPMSNIDAQAIAGLGASNGQAMPVSTDGLDRQPRFITTGNKGIPVRTGEHVMRVVFPAHTDGHGVFHDEAVAHVVSEPSGWTLRPADAPTARSLDATIAAGSPPAAAARASTQALTQASDVAPAGALTSMAPLNLREAAAGLSAPATPFPDPPQDQVAVDMPGSGADLPSAQAIAAARAGHRIGDAATGSPSAKARLQRTALHAHRRNGSRRGTVATMPGAATAALNRRALHDLGSGHASELASASAPSAPAIVPAGGQPQ